MLDTGTYAAPRRWHTFARLVLPRREPLAVCVEGAQVRGDVHRPAALAIDQPEVALEGRVELVVREHVEHGQLAAGARELADGAIGGRVEQVGDQDHRPALGHLGRVVAGSRGQVGRARACLDPGQVAQQAHDPAGAADGRQPSRDPPLQDADAHPVVRGQAHVRHRGRRALGQHQLVGRAAVHRRRGIDEHVDGDVLLLDEQLDEQASRGGRTRSSRARGGRRPGCSRDSR